MSTTTPHLTDVYAEARRTVVTTCSTCYPSTDEPPSWPDGVGGEADPPDIRGSVMVLLDGWNVTRDTVQASMRDGWVNVYVRGREHGDRLFCMDYMDRRIADQPEPEHLRDEARQQCLDAGVDPGVADVRHQHGRTAVLYGAVEIRDLR